MIETELIYNYDWPCIEADPLAERLLPAKIICPLTRKNDVN